jgi:hypothetical protein
MCWGIVVFLMLLSANALADNPRPHFSDGVGDLHHGGAVGGKASRDTTYLLGGPGRIDGSFEDENGNPSWNGWTHSDGTFNPIPRWQVSDFHVPAGGGALAMWCGTTYPTACDSGYGNSWTTHLTFAREVANPGVATTVRLQCLYSSDTEPGFDYFRIQVNRDGTWQNLLNVDDVHLNATFDQTVTYQPGDYVGPGSNQVQLRFQGFSDGAWSDEDCLWDTEGLAQVDNIRVTVGSEVFVDDFEDGASHHWVETYEPTVGDFAAIRCGLQDIDVCASNTSCQVTWIDDGIVVPGTGGTMCTTWCYGPGGYIVNHSGGLQGPNAHLDNLLLSPVLTWPGDRDGGVYSFDVYRHEDLNYSDTPGIFYQWHVRSIASGNPDDIEAADWEDRNSVYYGRGYRRHDEPISDLLVPGCTHVQVAFRVIEYGWVWGPPVDGTPAPYFDNAAVKAFAHTGPTLTAREVDLAQDSFPEQGEIDLVNLAANWVRFDMAQTISPDADLYNNPGDSILVDIGLPRAGSVLAERPRLVVKMKANPLFDGVRVLPANFTQADGMVDGWVYGDTTRLNDGEVVPGRWNFDLPDSSFLFPGDVLHYHFEARDRVGGDVGVTTLPADLGGFGAFDGPLAYPGTFTVRALPGVRDAAGAQARVLFWNDAPGRGADDEWFLALANVGVDYDLYETNAASSGVGNGLGGRATADVLAGYDILLYTSGTISNNTLANNDFLQDPSNDLGVVSAWFAQGGKKALLTGDDLVRHLSQSGAAALAFRNQNLGVTLRYDDLAPHVQDQTAPRVAPVPGSSVPFTLGEWIAYGSCPTVRDFDAVDAQAGTERLAEFLPPSGGGAGYTFAAASRKTAVADVILLPYDLASLVNSPASQPPGWPVQPARAWFLADVLQAFGWSGGMPPTDVPQAGVFTVSAAPNPFNPRTTIVLNLPRAGDASLRVFDLRGRLVRTLHEGPLTAGRHELVWSGDDDNRRAMASGVYFYEAKAVGEERIGKLTLVR